MTAIRHRSSGTWAAAALLAALALLLTGAPTAQGASSGAPVRVIVSGVAGTGNEVAEAVTSVGGDVLRRLDVVSGVVAEVPAGRQAELARTPGVRAVTPDGQVTVSGAYENFDSAAWTGSLPSIAESVGATDLWEQGVYGQGVDVAMVDTGISEVPGLDDGQVWHGPDLSFDSQDPGAERIDTYGHGTHLAGIIAGQEAGTALPSGAEDADDGLTGLAPGARLVSVKIGNRDGLADVSQAIAAIDWVVQHRNTGDLDIKVLNLAFGLDSEQGYEIDPLAYAAEVAWRKGIVVVAAAGNGGSKAGLSSPAYSPHVLAVGATDHRGTRTTDDDVVPTWSSCDPKRNPDVLAPGRSVVSARVPVSWVSHHHPESRVTDTLARGSGTSQAAAVVSGAAALLLSQHPEATPDQIRALLTSTANPVKTNASKPCQGNGVIDLTEASTTALPTWGKVWAPHSNGQGSLEDARGTVHIRDGSLPDNDPDAVLQGEQDIFGQDWNGTQWSGDAWAGTSWSNGRWNGTQWSGTQWSGTQWSGTQWSGTQWSGTQWSGTQWSGTQWSGTQWSGTQWSGTQWSGTQWSGTQWSSVYP